MSDESTQPAPPPPVPEPLPPRTSGPLSMPPPGPERSAWLRRFAKLWGAVAFILIVAFWFRAVLMPFVFAIVVAYVLAPVVNRLSRVRLGRRTMPRGAAVLLCYIVVLGVAALFFTAFLPRLSGDFARLGREAPKLWERVHTEYTPQVARWLERNFPSIAPPPEPMVEPPAGPLVDLPPPPGTVLTVTPMANGDYAIALPDRGVEVERLDDDRLVVRSREDQPPRKFEEVLQERVVNALKGLEGQVDDLVLVGQRLVTGLANFIMQFFLVLMVAAFLLIDLDRVHAFLRSLIPDRYQVDYDDVVAGVDRGLSGVIRGQLIICLVNGVLTYIGLLIFQVKYGLLLSVIAAVMSLIPIFGSILSSIPIVAIAMVSAPKGLDVVRGFFILAWILGIHFVEANFLNPKIIGSSAKIHPVFVIFALIAGEHTYGLVGALLAVPVASIIQTLFVFFRSRTWRADVSGPTTIPK